MEHYDRAKIFINRLIPTMRTHSIHWPRPWGVGRLLTMAVAACFLAGALSLPLTAQEGLFQAERALENKRNADPNWKPKYKEFDLIRVPTKKGVINNFCLNSDGNLVVCVGTSDDGTTKGNTELEIISPSGKVLKTIPLPFNPQAICTDGKDAIYVGGGGQLCKLNSKGKIEIQMPAPAFQLAKKEQETWKVKLAEEIERQSKELKEANPGMKDADIKKIMADQQKAMEKRRGNVTGLAVVGKDLMVATPSPAEFGYMVWRVDEKLANPVPVLKRLSGCCGQMDIRGRDGKLWVAHNAKHLVECYDSQGNLLSKFGKHDRVAADGFGGCCEPKNLTFASNGDILAAESGPPVVVKRFTPEGKFLGVLANPLYKSGCVRATVAISADEKKIFLLNTGYNAIHIFTL